MMNIKYLRGSAYIINDFPHLKDAQVRSTFDVIAQLKDKSFVIKSSTDKKNFAINIEDGTQSVHPKEGMTYCRVGESSETHNCATWRGDLKSNAFFTPGPDKDIGKTEHLNWNEMTRSPAMWMWLVIGYLVWQTLSYQD